MAGAAAAGGGKFASATGYKMLFLLAARPFLSIYYVPDTESAARGRQELFPPGSFILIEDIH